MFFFTMTMVVSGDSLIANDMSVLSMVDEVQQAFDESIHDLTWMDEATKDKAKEKNRRIIPEIGYPENTMNDTFLNIEYSNYNYNKDDFFGNVLNNSNNNTLSGMHKNCGNLLNLMNFLMRSG